MTDGRAAALRVGLVAAVAAAALLVPWLADRRPRGEAPGVRVALFVTSGRDAGPGTLRDAIYDAARAPGRASIRIDVPRVTLDAPLPPLVNPGGIALDGRGAVLDASRIAGQPALELRAPGSLVSDLAIRGSTHIGVSVRAPDVRLAGVRLEGCRVGVAATGEARGLAIEDSRFAANGIGIELSPEPSAVEVRRSRFRGHRLAGVWQVAPVPRHGSARSGLVVRDCRFDGDATGLVLINVPARVEQCELSGSIEAAMVVGGAGIEVRGNRIRAGAAHGVVGAGLAGGLIERNEIEGNAAVGALIRDSRATVVRDNRLAANGYGVALVLDTGRSPNQVAGNLVLASRLDGLFLAGASPLVRDNRVLGSGQAGIRILDYQAPDGDTTVSRPLLAGNAFVSNALDEPQRGVYRSVPVPEIAAPGGIAPLLEDR